MKKSLFTTLYICLLGLTGQALASDLVIYSGRSDKFVKPVVEAFTKQTGIKVTLHTGSSTALLNKLKMRMFISVMMPVTCKRVVS
jgi:iron(III) transport system substrate-binding protein